MSKIAMSVLTKGLAMDFEREGRTQMAISSIWPAVAIQSAATERLTRADPEALKDLRKAVSPTRFLLLPNCNQVYQLHLSPP